MKSNRLHSLAISAITAMAATVLVGCGEATTTSDDAGGATSGDSDTSVEHSATGTVNSIDRAAGTINISHEPVESIGWPAMTMNFMMADPESVDELRPGQRVEFKFTTEGGGTVTMVEAAR
jgi:Cu/Ag efflux protein CusF